MSRLIPLAIICAGLTGCSRAPDTSDSAQNDSLTNKVLRQGASATAVDSEPTGGRMAGAGGAGPGYDGSGKGYGAHGTAATTSSGIGAGPVVAGSSTNLPSNVRTNAPAPQ